MKEKTGNEREKKALYELVKPSYLNPIQMHEKNELVGLSGERVGRSGRWIKRGTERMH